MELQSSKGSGREGRGGGGGGEKQKYSLKVAVGEGRPGQDWNLWEQFGKLMFDWEEGTVSGLV